jgi:hypothetical protein
VCRDYSLAKEIFQRQKTLGLDVLVLEGVQSLMKWRTIGPDEETNDPLVADARNFYKVEKWTRDGANFCQGDKAPAADQADHPAGERKC